MIAKINKTGIISDTIQKFDGEKYLTLNDFGFDVTTDIPETLSNVIDAQALAEAAALNAIEAKGDAIENVEILVEEATNEIQTVVSEIKEETLNAQSLAELAAVNAIESEQTIQTIASEIEQIAADTLEAKNLAETAAINALEAERNVQTRANEIVEQAASEAINAKNLAETAAMDVQTRANEIVEEATSQAVNAKNLSETAAVNALESERNAQAIKEELEDFVVTGKKSVRTVGDQWITFDGTIPEGGIPFHGQTLSIEVYKELYQWVIDNDRFIEETEWQEIKENNNNNVPHYSVVNETTFRVPLFNGYFKADIVGGNYVQEGLPNITGNYDRAPWEMEGYVEPTGAFYASGDARETPQTANFSSNRGLGFDASRSNSIYGNSEHVTPETTTVIIGVYAIGTTVQNASNLDIADIRNALSVANTYDSMPLLMSHWDKKGFVSPGWVKADAYWLSGDQYTSAYAKILEKLNNGDEDVTEETYTNSETTINPDKFLIDTNTKMFRLPFVNGEKVVVKKKGDNNSKEWYELFADGHLIQGNEFYNNATVANVITLPISFKNTNYFITKQNGITTDYYDSIHNRYASVSSLTTSSFVSWTYNADGINRFRWSAEGESNIIPPSQYTENVALYFKLGNVFINEDQMDATAISNKVDEIRNTWANTIRVLETYNDGTSWYRKYSDGFIEQFGQLSITSSVSTKSFLLPFTNKPNVILSRESLRNGASYDNEMYPQSITTTNFTYKMNTSDVRAATWYACGY